MIRRPPRSTRVRSSAASDVYKRQDLHHRTPEFRAMFTRVREGLKEFIGTNEDVIVLASSGTGAMEASVANLVNAGDAVAVITAGKFGERWVGICRAFGCN